MIFGTPCIFDAVKYLGRQGIQLRGDDNRDVDLWQLELMCCRRTSPAMESWITRLDNFMFGMIPNEIIKFFSHAILKNFKKRDPKVPSSV